MFPARLAIAKATEDAQPAAGGTCETFNATLKLFTPAALGSSQVTLNEITAQSFEITHVGTNQISQGQEVIVGQTIDERWITLPSSTGQTTAHPRIQFLTLAKISQREVQVKVLRTHHNAPNPATGLPLQYGDTLTICDPFNLWSDIEPGATGWAYLAYASVDDPETTGVTEPSHPARYEIEECSLPINELEGTIEECLLPGTASVEVRVVEDVDIRSSYPNVDWPPEVADGTEGGASGEPVTAYKFIQAQNNLHLDAVKGSKVVIRRITNLMSSDPDPNYTCPKSRSSTAVEWEIVHVEEWWARIIKVKRTTPNTDWFYASDYGDGEWGGDDCPYTISSDADTAEDICGDAEAGKEEFGWAIWKTKQADNEAKYQALSSKSALLGDAEEVTFVSNAWISGCDLAVAQEKAKVFCKGDITIERSSIHPEEKVVLTAGALSITNECGSCSAVVIAKVRNIALVWDGANWVLAAGETCDGSYTAPNNPGPDDPHLAVVPCTTKEWKTTASCGSTSEGTCVCDTSSMPDASTQAIGATWTGTCTDPGGTPAMQLCWTYETETIYTLPCPGSPVTGGGSSCIPLTDCPEEESGGGGTP